MINRLYVDNYKCLVNFELRPGEIALLLGGNGSGKPTVLDVAYAVREILSGARKIADPEAFPARFPDEVKAIGERGKGTTLFS